MIIINILLLNNLFNKLASEIFTAKLKQANFATKNDIVNFVKKTNFDNILKNYIK